MDVAYYFYVLIITEKHKLVNHTKSFLETRDSTKLFYQIFPGESKKWLIIIHGIGEHSARHLYLKEVLASAQYNLCFFDLRGHGKSEGKKGYVTSFKDYLNDLVDLMKLLKDQYGMQEYSLFGHSMGALIICYMMKEMSDFISHWTPEKVFLSAPPVSIPGIKGLLASKGDFVVNLYRKISQGLYMPSPVYEYSLSHNKKVFDDYNGDPLVLKELHTNLLLSLIQVTNKIFRTPIGFPCPVFCVVANSDTVVNPKKAIEFFSQVEEINGLLIIPGAYHEMHNEIDKYRNVFISFVKDVFRGAAG